MEKGFSPINFQFVASGIAIQAKGMLYGMKPARVDGKPTWNGSGQDFTADTLVTPITDRSYWEGRYALTEITLRKPDGETLTINDATVSLNLKKEIVTTTLVGLQGTIKEYITTGDYDIRITVGIVATEGGRIVDDYPEEGINTVREFLDLNEALEVQSTFFDIFGITRLVITDYSLNQDTHSNRQVIDIKALSDEDYEINCTEY